MKPFGQIILEWLGQVLTLTFLFKKGPALFQITFTDGFYSNNNQNNYEWLYLYLCFVVACSNFPKTNQKTNGQFWKPALRDVTNGTDTWLKAVLPTVRC